MAKKYLVALDLVQNELQNARVQNLAFAPGSGPAAPVKGQLFYNTTDDTLYWWNGSQWMAAKAAAGATPAASVTTQAVGDAAVVGVSTNFAREDHKHGREAFGASTAVTTFGAAKADGGAATVARSDHTHGSPTHDNAAHSAITLASLSAPFGNVTAQTSFAAASNNGAGTSAARNDHVHGTPTHDAAAHSTIPLSAHAAATANVDMGGFRITTLMTPTGISDAATKNYVDSLVMGLAWKDACSYATIAQTTLSGQGQTIDGVVISGNSRILVKNQTNGAENGIYLTAVGAWTRTEDADLNSDLVGATVFVAEGATMADTAWTMTTNMPITVGTTPLTWVQFGAGTTYTAGNGLTLTGATIDVVGDASIAVAADSISRAALTGDVTATAGSNATTIAAGVVTNGKLANMPSYTFKVNNSGSTGPPGDVNAAGMKTLLGYPSKYTQATIGGATSQVVTHNLNTRDVVTNVYRTLTPWDEIECDVEMTSVNTITLRFATAPAANEYSCVVIG